MVGRAAIHSIFLLEKLYIQMFGKKTKYIIQRQETFKISVSVIIHNEDIMSPVDIITKKGIFLYIGFIIVRRNVGKSGWT